MFKTNFFKHVFNITLATVMNEWKNRKRTSTKGDGLLSVQALIKPELREMRLNVSIQHYIAAVIRVGETGTEMVSQAFPNSGDQALT